MTGLRGIGGSGGSSNPTITTATISSNFPVTQSYADALGAGMVAITGLACTITTTRTNEVVNLKYAGEMVQGAASGDMFLGYQIDSGTPVALLYGYFTLKNAYTFPMVINKDIVVTGAPGTYTIKLCASTATGSPVLACRVGEGTATDLIEMTVTQY